MLILLPLLLILLCVLTFFHGEAYIMLMRLTRVGNFKLVQVEEASFLS